MYTYLLHKTCSDVELNKTSAKLGTFNLWSLWDWGLVLFKPPNWEVHDANSELQLANFMEAMFGPLRILKDEDHEHGPSAGVFLGQKNYGSISEIFGVKWLELSMFAVVVRGLFSFILQFPSAKYCEGSKSHPVKDMEVLQISESGCFKRIQKTTNKMQKDAMMQSMSFCLPNWLTSGEVTVFWKFSPPSTPPHAELVDKFQCSTEVSCIAWMSQVRDWF